MLSEAGLDKITYEELIQLKNERIKNFGQED